MADAYRFTISEHAMETILFEGRRICTELLRGELKGKTDEVEHAFEAELQRKPSGLLEVYVEKDRSLCLRLNRNLRERIIARARGESVAVN